LQPSAFGVGLIVAVWVFVRGESLLAGLCILLTMVGHFTYALPGALLAAGFLTSLLMQGKVRQATTLAVFLLALALPMAYSKWLWFAPTSAEAFAEAQDILVNVRIPHHARIEQWLDPIAALQI